jgi:hypothetical protein
MPFALSTCRRLSQADCYVLSFKPQLKPLFNDCGACLRSRALVDELKAHLLVKVPCGIETRKGLQVNALAFLLATEVDSGANESSSNAFPAQGIGHYEPPKMRAAIRGVRTVDRDGTFHLLRDSGNPECVTKFVVAAKELRESPCDLRFKQWSESPMGLVIAGV